MSSEERAMVDKVTGAEGETPWGKEELRAGEVRSDLPVLVTSKAQDGGRKGEGKEEVKRVEEIIRTYREVQLDDGEEMDIE